MGWDGCLCIGHGTLGWCAGSPSGGGVGLSGHGKLCVACMDSHLTLSGHLGGPGTHLREGSQSDALRDPPQRGP